MIWLAIKTIVGTYQSVLKWSHDDKDCSASWSISTGDDHGWRVIARPDQLWFIDDAENYVFYFHFN